MLALGLAACCAAVAAEREAKPKQVTIQTKRVALFKNGLGFFVGQAALPDTAGPFALGPLPVPSHGTFWVSYPKGVDVDSIVARERKEPAKVDAITIVELLRANVGREVVLWLADTEKPVQGTLVACPPDRPAPQSDPYAMGRAREPSEARYYGSPAAREAAALAMVQTKEGVVAFAPGSVKRIQFPGGEPVRTVARETTGVELEVRLGKAAGGKQATVSYLAKGITWAPSYMVDISDPKSARISASAVIVNECQDLRAVNVDLVTGYPNLELADVPSPLAVTQDLAGFLRLLAGERREPAAAAYAAQTVAYAPGVSVLGDVSGVAPRYAAARVGQVKEDLFLYPLGKVTLAKRETGYFTLFTESVPYHHVYRWEIPDYLETDERYVSYEDRERIRKQRGEQVVWHCLRLENATRVPWTTAPAETVRGDQILGQSSLDFTPPKGTATLRITQAVSVRAEESEQEIQRQVNALQAYDGSYDKVTVLGTLNVTNFKSEPVPLEITKTLVGEIQETHPEAKVEKSARGLRRVNPTSVLKWAFTLKPGEAKTATYQCTVFVRR